MGSDTNIANDDASLAGEDLLGTHVCSRFGEM
jgi:hypothetical protein